MGNRQHGRYIDATFNWGQFEDILEYRNQEFVQFQRPLMRCGLPESVFPISNAPTDINVNPEFMMKEGRQLLV